MFKNSKFEGYGQFFYNDGRYYEGDFSDHKYHGWGTFLEINQDKYTGDFKKGVKEGVGVYVSADGSKYEGLFKNGKRHGKGIMQQMHPYHKDELDIFYSGQWFDDIRQGEGHMIWYNP